MASYVITWPTLGFAILVFGFAPGVVLRLILLMYPRDNPRRKELIGELYAVPRIERPFWVAEQFEIAIFEGLRHRFGGWRAKQLPRLKEARSHDFVAQTLRDSIRKRAPIDPFDITLDEPPGWRRILDEQKKLRSGD